MTGTSGQLPAVQYVDHPIGGYSPSLQTRLAQAAAVRNLGCFKGVLQQQLWEPVLLNLDNRTRQARFLRMFVATPDGVFRPPETGTT